MRYDMKTAATKARDLIAASPRHIEPAEIVLAGVYVSGLLTLNSNQKAALISLIAHIGMPAYKTSDIASQIDQGRITGRWNLQQLKASWQAWHQSEPEYWQREAEFDLFICERD